MKEPRQDAKRDDAEMRDLMQTAGPRKTVPEADLARIKAAFRTDWQARQEAAPAGRSGRGFAPRLLAWAATLALATLGGWWWWQASLPPAELVKVVGTVVAAEPETALAAGESLPAGSLVEVRGGASSASLRLPSSASLRLAGDSRLRLLRRGRVELLAGAVYVDAHGAAQVTVATPFGEVSDIGTQFEVRLLPQTLRVRVREGEVVWRQGDRREGAAAPLELTVDTGGRVERRALTVHGDEWWWIARAAPAFALDGRSVAEVVAWAARESGWQVDYVSPAAAREADETVLRGGSDDLSPREALDVALASTTLRADLADGRLRITSP